MKTISYFHLGLYLTAACLIATLVSIIFKSYSTACIFGVNFIVYFIFTAVFEHKEKSISIHIKNHK